MGKKYVVVVSFVFILILFVKVNLAHAEVEHKVTFKKVLEFSDDSEDFYFKYPDNPFRRQLQVDKDGNIYILDNNQILKFDNSGRFIKNLMVYGQGPGEVTNLKKFILQNDKIIIFNHHANKIIIKDKNGNLLKEFRISKYLDNFFAVFDKHYYSINEEEPDRTKNYEKIIDLNWYLTRVSKKGKAEIFKECNFPLKSFVVSKEGGLAQIRLNKILVAKLKEDIFFVNHSPEYEIKLLDVKKNVVVKKFKREYKRQQPPPEVEKKLNRQAFQVIDKVYRRPPQKYLNDIQQLLVYGNNLWVVTSTVDKKNCVLIDVFSKDCKYTGCFYLKLSERMKYKDYFFFHAYIFDGFLYTIEKDIDDNPWVVKYEILAE